MASRFASIKDVVSGTNRNKRHVSTTSTTSQPSKASTNIDTTSLTVFEIKKEITSKHLQNEEICALTVCKNLIYLATKSGRISIFEERVNQQTSRRSSSSVQSHIKHKRSADHKKAKNIRQMAVCLDVNIMILVLNNGHYLCMDALNLVEYTDTKKKKSLLPLNKTKNAERIIPSFKRPYYRFAIASKKNIYVFEWDKNNANYAFVRDISTGEPCVSCLFYNNLLCFSTHKKGFVMHDIKADKDHKINVPSMANNVPRMYQISHHDDDYKDHKDDGHLLVQASPNLMIFIDKTGNPAQKDTVNWSATPLFVIDCKQYMMGYLENKQIEIISLVDQKPVQILDIKGRSIQGMYRSVSDHIIIYDSYEVLSLVPTPMHQQISECIKHLRIEKGLKLLMNDGVGPTQNELRAFQAEAGFALLCHLQWKRCMEHLEMSDVDPRDIIYLFPGIKFAGFEYEIQHASAPRDCSIHDIIIEGLRDRQLQNNKQEARNEYLHSIYYLGEFLWKRRSDPSSDDLKIVGAELKLCVDTALLKIYVELKDKNYSSMAMNKGGCAPFAIEELLDYDEVNACVESECEKILISHQQYYNLALFYRSKKRLEKALHCLYCIGATKEWVGDVEDAMHLSIDILALMTDNKQHLWTYAQWVLKSNALQAMNIFNHSARSDPKHALYIEFDKVIQYLNEDIISEIQDYSDVSHFDYNEYYLEFIVASKCACDDAKYAKYHDDLAYLYMKKIQKLIQLGGHRNGDALDATRDKLLKFLEKSQLISPAKLLQHAKKFQLYDEIIELNKKLKNHGAVLYTLIIDKKDHNEAIRYCMETTPCSKDRSDRFLELLRLYFATSTDAVSEQKENKDNITTTGSSSSSSAAAAAPQHMRNETINIELLQEELNAENDEFAFMDSMVDTTTSAGGMNFDFDEVDLNISGAATTTATATAMEDDDAYEDEMKDEITDLSTRTTRTRNRGVTSQLQARQREEEDDEEDESQVLFDKGLDILYEYAFEIDYLSVLRLLPWNKDVMYFSKYIKKVIPAIVHKGRITKIKKNLHKRQYLRQRTNLAKAQSIAIRMDFNSICYKCGKNIGTSVFILDPKTKNKFHYSCFYRKRAPKNENIIITNQHHDSDNNPFISTTAATSIDNTNPFQSDLDTTNPFS